jgi:exoribonuclease R
MYKFITETNNYEIYNIIETSTFQPILLNIHPFELKLFNNDTFNLPNEIVHSPIRLNKYNTGVLVLNKTYGKEGKKFLYLCIPDDKRIPHFLIPYNIPVTFEKTLKNLYITFEFKHWNNKNPHGTITQNFGTVDEINNYYEYMMYSKSLNVSIQEFTKKTINSIHNNNIINDIIHKYNIPIIDDNVFTIDTPNTIDFDDAISINDDIISIYISNVAIVIDYLNLWDSFTNRISNIYLPNKKYNMLPSILGQLCSLNKDFIRICLKIDININTEETTISNCAVKINNNYEYNDESLNKNKDYLKIKELYKNKNSSQIIETLMIKSNTISAKYMSEYKDGIFKIINHSEELSTSNYELYNVDSECKYLTITSPIRRLVDILNIYKLCVNKNIFQFNNEATKFYNNWISKLDYINITSKNIRKVQSKCNILNACVLNNHSLFKGKVFDKIVVHNKYKYQVYLFDLNVYSKIYSPIELDEKIEYIFKLYVFQNESSYKNKIKLDIT